MGRVWLQFGGFKNLLRNFPEDIEIEYVHVYMSHLHRKSEEDAKAPRYTLTVHGVGNVFETGGMPSSS